MVTIILCLFKYNYVSSLGTQFAFLEMSCLSFILSTFMTFNNSIPYENKVGPLIVLSRKKTILACKKYTFSSKAGVLQACL